MMESSGTKALRSREGESVDVCMCVCMCVYVYMYVCTCKVWTTISFTAPGRPAETGEDDKKAPGSKRLFVEDSGPSSPTKKKRKVDD